MIIEIDNIWKRFGRFDALEGLSLTVPEGSAFALIGANGAGKSTTIKILMNLIEASRGTAKVLGVDSRNVSPRLLCGSALMGESAMARSKLASASS